jgi:hypothetical protein
VRTVNVTLVVNGNQAPTATINSPATNVTINPGGAVQFSGSGTDSDGTITGYSWTFPGGTPASASVATPGNVVYATPGSYTASFRVTDNGGLVSAPAARTVTVADFTLSATPSSRTILPGASTTYTATATAGTGFTGTVAFSVTGLPAGATASFSPTSVTPSGTSTLTITTTTAILPGSYPLTIRGTSGPRVRTVNVTLVVNSGTFSITASPTSRTVSRGGATTYTVSVPGGTGFVGTIALSVSGVPGHTTVQFVPTTIVNSGTSTLTVDTRRRVTRGTYTLVIRGTSGGTIRTVSVTLIVQ